MSGWWNLLWLVLVIPLGALVSVFYDEWTDR